MIYAGAAVALIGLLLFFLEEPASADSSGAGNQFTDAELYPAPPPDDFANPEVGDAILGGSGMPVTTDKINLLAEAIATAEGWTNPNPNVVPRRAHNPGDLTRSFGQPTAGVANGEGVLIFADDDAGWSALKAQATAMLTGASRIYSPTMTVRQIAAKYTGNDNSDAWAANAASVLGISPDQTLAEFLGD